MHAINMSLVQVRIIIQLLRKKEVRYAELEGQKTVKQMTRVVRLVHRLIESPQKLDTMEIVVEAEPRDVHVGTHKGCAFPFVFASDRPCLWVYRL